MQRPYLYLSSAEAQLSLGFGEDRPPESLFFALMPPAPVAARAHALARDLLAQSGQRREPIAAARLHVTLHYLGTYSGIPQRDLDDARQAAERVAMAPFPVCLDRVGGFGKGREGQPCVLTGEGEGTAGIHALHAALNRALAGRQLKSDRRAFTPHMTLFYGPAMPAAPVQPVRWVVDELVLLRSFVGQGRYQEEGRWPLRGTLPLGDMRGQD